MPCEPIEIAMATSNAVLKPTATRITSHKSAARTTPNFSAVTKPYKPNQGNCSGLFFSFKNNTQCPWRGVLEREAMTILDVDPAVKSFVVEPVTIPYVMPSGRRSHYTPDRFICFADGRAPLLVEIKPKRKLKKARKLWKAKFAAATAEAVKRGWEFQVWTEADIRGPALENADFLRMFLPYSPDFTVQGCLLTAMADKRPATLGDLIYLVAPDDTQAITFWPQLWKLVAMREISVDWKTLITKDSQIIYSKNN